MGGADDFDTCFVDRRAERIAQRRIGNREVENIVMLLDDEAGVFVVHMGGENGFFDLFHTTTLKCRCVRIHVETRHTHVSFPRKRESIWLLQSQYGFPFSRE